MRENMMLWRLRDREEIADEEMEARPSEAQEIKCTGNRGSVTHTL
jgi:hypothetical protein